MADNAQYDLSRTPELNPENRIFRHSNKNKKSGRKQPQKYFPYQTNNLVNTGFVKTNHPTKMEKIEQQLLQLVAAYNEMREILVRMHKHQTATSSLQVNTANEVCRQLAQNDHVLLTLCNLTNQVCDQIGYVPPCPLPSIIELPSGALDNPLGTLNNDLMGMGQPPLKWVESLDDLIAEEDDFAQFLGRDEVEASSKMLMEELQKIDYDNNNQYL
jgi:hypothetical protein